MTCPFSNHRSLFVIGLLISLCACKAKYAQLSDGIYADIATSRGVMTAQLNYKKTPVTVANFISLSEGTNPAVAPQYRKRKFYDGLTFHRVIPNFVIQAGDAKGDGSGHAGYRFVDEFDPKLKHTKKGILAMANSGPNANGSQFYITHKATPWLDAYNEAGELRDCNSRQVSCHTVFGKIVLGQHVIDAIQQNDTIRSIKIIRKGREAKRFKAAKVFKQYYETSELHQD